MKSNFWILFMVVLVAAMFITGGALYAQMPAQMASHWNAAGTADGTIARFWGVFLFPLISLALLGLLLAIPNIDPLRANIARFKNYYYGFIVVFLAYFLYVYVLTLLWNLEVSFDMTRALIPAVGILFLVVGLMMLKAKRNYFIGIRTPWTLSNDEVWDRTHKLGGRLFIITGVVTAVIGAFLAFIAIWVMLGLILATTLVTVVYSYVIFRRLEKEGKATLVRPGTK
ncbi:MAG: SdpI family protein [Dehalococcoidales bacterium]|nr:SdpI family protein [Dehalococcoidales bacterium]